MLIQARTGSSRLPGKVLAEIGGRPLLALLLERVRAATSVAEVVVATTTLPGDDPVAELCRAAGVRVIRGHPTDVLTRFAVAARELDAAAIVRISADSPFVDGAAVDAVVACFRERRPDIAQNHIPQDWPFGTAIEAVSRDCLERLDAEVSDERLREHVTLHVYENPDDFEVVHVTPPPELYAPGMNLCVDYPEDLERVRSVWGDGGDPRRPLSELVAGARALSPQSG